MKRTIYTLCTAVCALFAVVSCSKSDDNNGNQGGGITNNNFSSEVTKVVPQDLIQKMAAGGATIYGGTNPPIVQPLLPGLLFTTGELELIHTSLGDKDLLKNFEGYLYKFYEQNGTKLRVNYSNLSGGTYAARGVDAAISGDGDKFTIFFVDKVGDLVALSGEFTGDAIKNFQLTSLVKVADKNSPVGTVRVFKSKRGYAETIRESDLYNNSK
jgi:putative uncharacterized protein (fragment)